MRSLPFTGRQWAVTPTCPWLVASSSDVTLCSCRSSSADVKRQVPTDVFTETYICGPPTNIFSQTAILIVYQSRPVCLSASEWPVTTCQQYYIGCLVCLSTGVALSQPPRWRQARPAWKLVPHQSLTGNNERQHCTSFVPYLPISHHRRHPNENIWFYKSNFEIENKPSLTSLIYCDIDIFYVNYATRMMVCLYLAAAMSVLSGSLSHWQLSAEIIEHSPVQTNE